MPCPPKALREAWKRGELPREHYTDDGQPKHRYKNYNAALIASKKILTEYMHPYKCKYCQGWHIGH